MAFIENKIQIGEKAIESIFGIFTGFIKGLLNQPKWLIVAVMVSILMGGCYFWYSHKEDKENIKELQEQVIQINEVVGSNLGVEDLIYIITEIKILKCMLDENYQERIYTIDVIKDYLVRYHPNDPAIGDINTIKRHMELNKDTYSQHYKYVMSQLDKIANTDTVDMNGSLKLNK